MSRSESISCDMCSKATSRSDATKFGWKHVAGNDLCHKCLDELLELHRRNLLAAEAYHQRWSEGRI